MKNFKITRAHRLQAQNMCIKYRDETGITQAALATQIDCTQGEISLLEKGHKISRKVIKRVLNTLGGDII